MPVLHPGLVAVARLGPWRASLDPDLRLLAHFSTGCERLRLPPMVGWGLPHE